MHRPIFIVLLIFGASPAPCRAEIILDFSHDAATDNFFGVNLTARAAMEAAVADINQFLTVDLAAITGDDDVLSAVSNGNTAAIDFNFHYTNPSTGSTESLSSIELAANEVRLFVGMRELAATTAGEGGPGGFGFAFGASSSSGFDGWQATIDEVAAAANAVYGRGGGPVIGSISGALPAGGDPGTYTIEQGLTHGNLWFDIDTNNDGLTDDASTLDANWHFDHTTDVADGKTDFYSVALHETLHALGVGTSVAWDTLVNGTEWLGSEGIGEFGTGLGLIDPSGGHLVEGTMSFRVTDGQAQEVAMSPILADGTRKYLTALDVALLRDLNVTAVPETSSLLALTLIGGGWMARRRRPRRNLSRGRAGC